MPEYRSLNTARRIQLLALVLFVSLSGCTQIGLEGLPPTPSRSFDELKQRVSRIRGLPFEHEVRLEPRGIKEIQALLDKSALEGLQTKKLQQVSQAYERLGLESPFSDFPKDLTEFRFLRESTHYDSQRKRVVVPKGPWRPGFNFTGADQDHEDRRGETGKQFLLTLALTHALQEQHFEWEEKLKKLNTDDTRLAFRALVNGDAILVGLTHLMGDAEENPLKVPDGMKGLTILASQMEKGLLELPDLLRQKTLLEVLYGSQFIIWAYSLEGWQGVNRLYSDPPITTEQILHPEKYYEKREGSTSVTAWSLIREFGNSGKKIVDETLGEFLIRVLLGSDLSEDEAAEAAAGWAGDQLLAFQRGEELVLGWTTAWDSPEEALQFYRSYRRALETRYGLSLTPGGNETLFTPPQSATPLLLQMKGNLVFFLDGVPWPRSGEVAQEVWKELETGSEPQTIPFDLVRHPLNHPSPNRK